MSIRLELARLMVITDRVQAEAAESTLVSVVERALGAIPPGAGIVQVREKDLPASELASLVRKIIAVARPRRSAVLVSDRLDVALAAGADGVHLPENGLGIATVRRLARKSNFLIGRSAHSSDGAGAAARDGADLVLVGPAWATPSKAIYGPPLGLEAIAAAARSVADGNSSTHICKCLAVGGIDSAERVTQAIAAGAHGIAAIRAFMSSPDPGQAAANLHAALGA